MKKLIFRSIQPILIFILALCFSRPAFAHGTEPRLEISAAGMYPGGVVDVRGVEFDYEEIVKLYLIRPGIVVFLGEIVADLEGVFLHTFVLPVDLPDGPYSIRAVTDHHDVLSPEFTIQGPAILDEGGGQGTRDEDDPLLAPMPTFAPGVVPGGVSQPAAAKTPEGATVESGASLNGNVMLLISSLLFIILITVWLRGRSLPKT